MESGQTHAHPSSFIRSRSPHTLSRKRARIDELDEVIQELQSPSQSDEDLVRDDIYYFSDGSCILRVENTLFNVHRTIICRDSSSFSSMFELPVPTDGGEVEGMSDENPIVLTGDTVQEFKHFLWALYALPHELMVVHSALANLTQLIDIVHVANKYSFRSLETWALDAINDYVNRKPSPVFTTLPYSLSSAIPQVIISENGTQISCLVRLAQTCNHERLLSTMILLLRQRMGTSIQYAFLAMKLADELDLKSLRGVAYMEVLQKGMIFPPMGQALALSQDDANGKVNVDRRLVVSREQQLRLLSGYYRLSRAWDRLRIHPFNFEHASTCSATWHQHGCRQSWLEFWKEKTRSEPVLALGQADVPGRLKAIVKEVERWGSATYMHPDCKVTARQTILEKIKEFESNLPDYFVEVEEGT